MSTEVKSNHIIRRRLYVIFYIKYKYLYYLYKRVDDRRLLTAYFYPYA
jgi:hypothetical protein